MLLCRMYFTMLPVVLGGIVNMLFTKTKLYHSYAYPIDCYKCLRNGKRIFGNNKTWVGFVSMIVFVSIFQILCGALCHLLSINWLNDFYSIHPNSFGYNLFVGISLGIVYMVLELPNSFIKRQLDIPSGKTVHGIKGLVFFLIDQIDSLIGVMFVLFILSDITVWQYFFYVMLGGFTHVIINLLLKLMKIRRNL